MPAKYLSLSIAAAFAGAVLAHDLARRRHPRFAATPSAQTEGRDHPARCKVCRAAAPNDGHARRSQRVLRARRAQRSPGGRRRAVGDDSRHRTPVGAGRRRSRCGPAIQESDGLLDPATYLTGRLPITAVGVLTTGNGVGRFQFESATVGGIPLPKTLLEESSATIRARQAARTA